MAKETIGAVDAFVTLFETESFDIDYVDIIPATSKDKSRDSQGKVMRLVVKGMEYHYSPIGFPDAETMRKVVLKLSKQSWVKAISWLDRRDPATKQPMNAVLVYTDDPDGKVLEGMELLNDLPMEEEYQCEAAEALADKARMMGYLAFADGMVLYAFLPYTEGIDSPPENDFTGEVRATSEEFSWDIVEGPDGPMWGLTAYFEADEAEEADYPTDVVGMMGEGSSPALAWERKAKAKGYQTLVQGSNLYVFFPAEADANGDPTGDPPDDAFVQQIQEAASGGEWTVASLPNDAQDEDSDVTVFWVMLARFDASEGVSTEGEGVQEKQSQGPIKSAWHELENIVVGYDGYKGAIGGSKSRGGNETFREFSGTAFFTIKLPAGLEVAGNSKGELMDALPDALAAYLRKWEAKGSLDVTLNLVNGVINGKVKMKGPLTEKYGQGPADVIQQAQARVASIFPKDTEAYHICVQEPWPEMEEHLKWLLAASPADIRDWVNKVKKAMREDSDDSLHDSQDRVSEAKGDFKPMSVYKPIVAAGKKDGVEVKLDDVAATAIIGFHAGAHVGPGSGQRELIQALAFPDVYQAFIDSYKKKDLQSVSLEYTAQGALVKGLYAKEGMNEGGESGSDPNSFPE